MKEDLLSTSEDAAFSETVIRYNRKERNGLDTEEGRYIKERTKNLIYLICKEQLMMSDDLISSVFLNVYEDIDRVIKSYRIASHSFNHYLKQVCIYRIRRVKHRLGTRRYIESAYISEADPLYTTDEHHLAPEREKEELFHSLLIPAPERYASMNMKDITDCIIEERNLIGVPTRSRKERILRNKLVKKSFRRNFLLFILSIPPGGDDVTDAKNYARVFQSDEAAFARLLYLKSEVVRRNTPDREKNLEKAAMHWCLMARIRNSMYRATSEEEYSVLKENYMSQVRCHRNRIRDARRSVKGIIHEDIASALGLSRSTVSMGISFIRRELERISHLTFS